MIDFPHQYPWTLCAHFAANIKFICTSFRNRKKSKPYFSWQCIHTAMTFLQKSSYCTGVQCCTEIGILGRSWATHILVDTCRYRVSIGIEKQTVNITLFEFVQGSWATVTLGNVLRLGYVNCCLFIFILR
jgi:hypothetical protein